MSDMIGNLITRHTSFSGSGRNRCTSAIPDLSKANPDVQMCKSPKTLHHLTERRPVGLPVEALKEESDCCPLGFLWGSTLVVPAHAPSHHTIALVLALSCPSRISTGSSVVTPKGPRLFSAERLATSKSAKM